MIICINTIKLREVDFMISRDLIISWELIIDLELCGINLLPRRVWEWEVWILTHSSQWTWTERELKVSRNRPLPSLMLASSNAHTKERAASQNGAALKRIQNFILTRLNRGTHVECKRASTATALACKVWHHLCCSHGAFLHAFRSLPAADGRPHSQPENW